MPMNGRHWEWIISCAVFAGILIALVIAVLLQDPLGAGVP
jgi:preprotein translocase subunit SecG